MKWSVVKARRNLAAVIEASANEPQAIIRRGRLVAAVVDGETFAEFVRWRSQQSQSLGEAFAELRRILAQDGGDWELATEPRQDRMNAFLEVLDEPALGHQCAQ